MKINQILIAITMMGIAGWASGQTGTGSSASPAGAGGRSSTTTEKSSGTPFVEGPVWILTFVKTKAGLGDDYLRQISGTVKPVYDEMKKEKIILDYKVLDGDSVGRDDFNVLIMVEYPNMAALDGLRERTEPIMQKVMGSDEQRRDMSVKRLDIREILATKTMREITLK